MVLDAQAGKLHDSLAFFDEEYKLDHMLATVDTPVVAIMDGITSKYGRLRGCWSSGD